MVVILSTTSCGSSGPTSVEAGRTLKSDILRLFEKRAVEHVTITDPGGRDISCGEDKARQTFAATGEDTEQVQDAEGLNAMLVGTLSDFAKYKVISANAPGQPVQLVNETARTILVFASPGNGTYVVSGMTECLPVP
jgi:hypothetical protein